MKKRYVSTIKQYDYDSIEAFEVHKKQMQEKGYFLIENGMFCGALDPGEIDGGKWVFTAAYLKSPFY